MEQISSYTTLRKVHLQLNHKIQKLLTREQVLQTAKVMGILDRNDTIHFENDEGTHILMELSLHEPMYSNRTIRDKYIEEIKSISIEEQQILNAFAASYTSLFRIAAVSKEQNILTLQDLLQPNRPNTTITDLSFSQSAVAGLLIYTRIIPFPDFAMTSGISFVFRPEIEQYLIQISKKLSKHIQHKEPTVTNFLAFYQLHNSDGIRTRYE